jgi:hypothetical protein
MQRVIVFREIRLKSAEQTPQNTGLVHKKLNLIFEQCKVAVRNVIFEKLKPNIILRHPFC